MTQGPIRIVGIDPGLRRTGWGLIAVSGNALSFLASGTIRAPLDGELAARLAALHEALSAVVRSWTPDEAAVEQTFVNRDAEMAEQVVERDRAVDDFYDSIFRTLLTHMIENPQNIRQCTHLLFVARNLERVGDHATNIAEMVYYAATGDHMPERVIADVAG